MQKLLFAIFTWFLSFLNTLEAHEVMKINSCGSMNKYTRQLFCLCSHYRALNIFVSRQKKNPKRRRKKMLDYLYHTNGRPLPLWEFVINFDDKFEYAYVYSVRVLRVYGAKQFQTIYIYQFVSFFFVCSLNLTSTYISFYETIMVNTNSPEQLSRERHSHTLWFSLTECYI